MSGVGLVRIAVRFAVRVRWFVGFVRVICSVGVS